MLIDPGKATKSLVRFIWPTHSKLIAIGETMQEQSDEVKSTLDKLNQLD